ncbi:D-arabinono-1,4-lactone oxidase [Bradyrhizobium sp. LHD-71]|uniref:D-arabinono-1,4-lactone oxidase n=1 Tax=Bradyrhizobium sp. LHD-71 TaxID=3072141 RepID=UPI00280D25C1|nr:D-arabinono-1,4-lactone oxidase [Bradyrhizobium sp. LHD-71]MDQ8731635.1 FAD-binding protein [Bradyrhizobium sp. LHD-71]
MSTESKDSLQKITNFGGNQCWLARRLRPSSEDELLSILERHDGATIRAAGSGHSWSGIVAHADIVLDMSAFNSVALINTNGQHLVRAGAGCRLQDLLDRLHAATDRTLPTLGAIKKQTISGAISTATHGSGRQSLSHFVVRVRAAVFTGSGGPEIREFDGGPELLAMRCGLGCTGIIVSVDLQTVPKYLVAETARRYDSIDQVIATFESNPLSTFTFSPYSWAFTAFERRAIARQPQSLPSRAKALAFRLYQLILIDTLFHLGVVGSRALGPAAVKFLQKHATKTLLTDVERVDNAEHVLTTQHDLFRHEEMELFVREADLSFVLRFLRAAVEFFSGDASTFPDELAARLRQANLATMLEGKHGSFVLHYPLFVRRILPEETLISMAAAADGPLYSVSIFTYDPPRQREPYYAFCLFVARALRTLVGARLHWGKHFPLSHSEIAVLYPELERFRAICRTHDPHGVLRNTYTARVLDLAPGKREDDRSAAA